MTEPRHTTRTLGARLEIGVAAFVAIVVLVGAAYAVAKPSSGASGSGAHEHGGQAVSHPASAADMQRAAAIITYGHGGFDPASVVVKGGEMLVVKNTTSGDLEFASGPHPAHASDPDLNIGEVQPGTARAFVVHKKGVFSVHNHLNPHNTAKVTVE